MKKYLLIVSTFFISISGFTENLHFCEDPELLNLFKINFKGQNKQGVNQHLSGFPEIRDHFQPGFRSCLDGLRVKENPEVSTSEYFLSVKVYDESNYELTSIIPLYYRRVSVQADHNSMKKQWIFANIPNHKSSIINEMVTKSMEKTDPIASFTEKKLQKLNHQKDLLNIFEKKHMKEQEAQRLFLDTFQMSEVTHFMKDFPKERYFIASYDKLFYFIMGGVLVSKQLVAIKHSREYKTWTFYKMPLFKFQNALDKIRMETQISFEKYWHNYLCNYIQTSDELKYNFERIKTNSNTKEIIQDDFFSYFINERDAFCDNGQVPERLLLKHPKAHHFHRFVRNKWIQELTKIKKKEEPTIYSNLDF